MAETNKGGAAGGTGDPPTYYGFPVDTLYDTAPLPDFETNFLPAEDVEAFVQALAAPDALQSPVATEDAPGGGATPASLSKRNSVVTMTDGPAVSEPPTGPPLRGPSSSSSSSLFIAAKNDWAPVYEKIARPDDRKRRGSSGGGGGAGGGGAGGGEPRGAVPRLFSSSWLPSLPKWRSVVNAPSEATTAPTTTAKAGRRQQLQQQQQQQQQQQRRRAAAASAAAAGKRARAKARPGRRTQDETREGYLYGLLKWPFLLGVFAWLLGLSLAYLLTRLYIAAYEQLITWRGRRETLRHRMRRAATYADWVAAAQDMDAYLGNDRWKEENEFAFYDFRTVRRVADQLRRCRTRAEAAEAKMAAAAAASEASGANKDGPDRKAVEDLKALIDACVKNNFAGVENRHLYSRTYYGTKNLVQSFVDEVERSLRFLIETNQLDAVDKRAMFKRLSANYGRTALCLSGGASFAYYHFGVVRALLDEDLLPDVITGTSGGALVAALVATRTNDELRQLLVPALAQHIDACSEPLRVWFPRWWKTGARFDSVAWASQCAWWTRGSMTFREAYERTGRVLNVTCVPADPHSPTILCNYRTAPDCVIWSAVLASAAVPGILNPVVLMMKTMTPTTTTTTTTTTPNTPDGPPRYRLVPYSFGHKWKDGSLRTDIPIKSLNLHFNVNFTVVSQVNPHVNLFFFSSRGSVGQPVTHRKGRGWRGGYLGSAFEEYLKQDLRKWLKLLRNLELLPRPLGQDWSQLWLQPFGGTITVWPKSEPADFVRLLADPDPLRLARMLHEGRQSAFPPLKFISNRLRIERLVERGRRLARAAALASSSGGGSALGNNYSNSNSNSNDDHDNRVAGAAHALRLAGAGHATSSSIDSLLSEDDLHSLDQQQQRQRRRRQRRSNGDAYGSGRSSGGGGRLGGLGGLGGLVGLSLGHSAGFGSTTATSDDNVTSASLSDVDDMDLSSGGRPSEQDHDDNEDDGDGRDDDHDDDHHDDGSPAQLGPEAATTDN